MSVPARFVVGVDGSECARRALSWTVATAEALGAEVVAVHALGLLTHLAGVDVPAQSQRAEVTREFEEQWCAPLASSTVARRHVLLDGNPVTALLGAADEYGADVIVVGSRGTGGFPGLQLGSTSHQLVQHSVKPVVVVPGPVATGASPHSPSG
jgi:nucleotide-binding universal stress UspA family protein